MLLWWWKVWFPLPRGEILGSWVDAKSSARSDQSWRRLLVAHRAGQAFEVWVCDGRCRGGTSAEQRGAKRCAFREIFLWRATTNCCQTRLVKQTGKGARFRARSESPRKSGWAGRQPPARIRIGKFLSSQALAGGLIKLCVKTSNLTRNEGNTIDGNWTFTTVSSADIILTRFIGELQRDSCLFSSTSARDVICCAIWLTFTIVVTCICKFFLNNEYLSCISKFLAENWGRSNDKSTFWKVTAFLPTFYSLGNKNSNQTSTIAHAEKSNWSIVGIERNTWIIILRRGLGRLSYF